MRVFGKILLIFLLGSGLLGGRIALSRAAVSGNERGVIRVARANVRKTPDKNSPRIFTLRRRDRVKIIKERSDWLYIESDVGRRGWIFSSLVKIVKPEKVKPEIKIFSDNLSGYQKIFFDGLVARIQARLADSKPREFAFIISRTDPVESASAPALKTTVLKSKPESWLLVLKSHFSRKGYQVAAAPEIEPGTIDLLIYQHQLRVLLESRDLLRAEMRKNPALWPNSKSESAAVEALLVLESESGDQIALSGYLKSGLPVFNDFIILEIHGFSPFSIKATLPANVTDFNQFNLPAPYLANGNRSTAALAHDFFGFSY